MSSRLSQYKNKALDNSELRRRREEEGVQIRKAKRDEQVWTITCVKKLRIFLKDQNVIQPLSVRDFCKKMCQNK